MEFLPFKIMNITPILNEMLDNETTYIAEIERELALFGESLEPDAIHKLKMGFRTKYIIDYKLELLRKQK